MTVDLEEFALANGDDRTVQVLAEESIELSQQTQSFTPSRGAWQVAFPERATRSLQRSYRVNFPPCATLEDALTESALVPTQCPKGGVLVEYHGGHRITYASAWINHIRCDRLGVRNTFTFDLTATDPAAQSLVLDGDGNILTDGDGNELEY